MNQTATQPLTTLELDADTQASTNMSFFSMLEPLETSTIPTFTELLAEYQASIDNPEVVWNRLSGDELDQPAAFNAVHLVPTLDAVGIGPGSDPDLASASGTDPFAIYTQPLANASPQPVRWLWSKRLSLVGLTLLDGDHGCGKSLLAVQIAAHVSAGTPMPDGSPTIQGGVIIVSPFTDATTTQLQLLTALGADLSRIQILSYIQEPVSESHTGDYHPFSMPEDFTHLLQAIKDVDARLIIFDPFISLLSRKLRWTDQRLGHLLADLNQLLFEHHVACLITRNCHAKGGHARPSVLERSDHFATIATSRLLLAPDPMQPDSLLLSHATSRHLALTPTLMLHIQPLPANHDFPYITFHGHHCLRARDLIENRPDTLRRRLLSQQLLDLITATTDPIHVSTLYALLPHSSPFQIQRSLSDLLRTDQIERSTRGFYTPVPPIAIPPFNSSAAINLIAQPAKDLNTSATITESTQLAKDLNTSAATTESTQSAKDLNISAAITKNTQSAKDLNTSAAITESTQPTKDLNTSAAITESTQPTKDLNTSAATTESTQLAKDLNTSAAITLKPKATNRPHKGRNKHRNTKKRH